MTALPSRAPHPPLSEHPEFAMMLAVTLERFHCTLGEVREDYWMGRAWRALAGDPVLEGRVARSGMGTALLTGAAYGVAPLSETERAVVSLHARDRILADCGRVPESLGLEIRWTDRALNVLHSPHRALVAQVVRDDHRWLDLDRYAEDLVEVVIPVAYSAEAVVAA